MPRNENCELCPLHRSSKNVCIWGHGDDTGFGVGEAPGKEEGRSGKVFQGESGQLLRSMLKPHGLDGMYITNVAKCRPPDNRKPEPNELKACKPYLLEEIEQRKPKVILLMGATAMKSFLGKTSITEMNGQVIEKNGQKFVCAFHPAYILRDPSKREALAMALGRYAAELKGVDRKMPDWRAIDQASFDEFIADWIQSKAVTIDVETAGDEDEGGDGLQWWKDGFDLTSISFSLRMESGSIVNWALALPGHPRAVLSFDLAKELLTELSMSCGGKEVNNHNIKFDNLCLLKRYGVTFHSTGDSMLAHHLIDENSFHGLKQLAREFCAAPDFDLTTNEKKNTRLVPIKRLLGYNASDTFYSGQLEPMFRERMDDQERWLYDRVIIPAQRAFLRSEANGLYIDVDFLNKTEAETRVKKEAVLKKMNKIAKREINWNSPQQVGKLLYHDLELVPTVFTDKKNPETGEYDTPSTGEAALVDIDHPIAKLLEEYRGLEKFLSTYTGELIDGQYVGGWREFMDGPHMYMSTKIHGTVTGRYSSRLHSTPRDGLIRNAVVAPPGWTFTQMDLSQAELRVIAILARDPTMLEVFRTGRDIHWYTLVDMIAAGRGDYMDMGWEVARRLSKDKSITFPDAIEYLRTVNHEEAIALFPDLKEGRKKSKGVNFGFAFGQQAPGFVNYAKLKYGFEPTLQESTEYRDGYFNRYSRVGPWHDRQKRLVHLDAEVRSMSGRRRRLPGIRSKDRQIVAECERQAINSPVQGFIGDYKAMIYVELDETFSPDHLRLVGEVHDSILAWVKNEHLDWVIPKMHHISENPKLAKECGLKFPIKMATDIELGRWGAGTKWRQ